MGGGSSKISKVFNSPSESVNDLNLIPHRYINKLSSTSRLDYSHEITTAHVQGNLGKYYIKFAFGSQRGYYPNDLDKANQDSYICIQNFMGVSYCHFFGIFDGKFLYSYA